MTDHLKNDNEIIQISISFNSIVFSYAMETNSNKRILWKITFLFFFLNFKATTTKNISIDDRNVPREPLMHHGISSKSLKFAIYNRHGDFYQKKRN